MSLPIAPVQSVASISSLLGAASPTTAMAGQSPFASVLANAIQKVEAFGNNADASVNRFLSGEGEELHQVALKTQQADMSFQLFMQIRNKMVAAYQQVMQMQI